MAARGSAAGGRGGSRPHARLLPLDRVLLRHAPYGARRPALGRGVHERLVRRLRRAAGAGSARARARGGRRRDDRGRQRHAPRRGVPRRLRLGNRRRRGQQTPPARARWRRAAHREGARRMSSAPGIYPCPTSVGHVRAPRPLRGERCRTEVPHREDSE